MRFERNFIFWLAVFLVLAGLLFLLHHVLLPFVVGAALAYLLDPLANRLTKRGMSRLVAALVILAGFVIVFAGALVLIAPVLANQLSAFIDHVPAYVQRLQAVIADPGHPWLKSVIGSSAGAGDWSTGVLINKSIAYLTDVLPTLLTKGEALLSLFSLLVITPVVAFYLLCDWNRVIKSFDDLIPLQLR